VLSLAAISLTAWVVSIPVAHAAARPDASSVILTLDSALAVLSVAGIETLVFGLVPLYFLEGDTLRRWSFRTWISIWSLGIVWFALVVVDPALNREAKGVRASVVWLVILLVAEATIAVGLWSYFAIRSLCASASGAEGVRWSCAPPSPTSRVRTEYRLSRGSAVRIATSSKRA
jgi:hypothetical protein